MVERSTLPGAPEDDAADPIVLHVDLDCFYAACERLREPALDGEPVVVGMGYEPGETVGAVATASYEAREYGIESAQAITTALERLPRAGGSPDEVSRDAEGGDPPRPDEPVGYYRPVDMEYYESIAEDVKAILQDCADTVREVSIDEAYLDVTERTAWDVADGFARHVKGRIEREVGLTASVGVAPTMHAAKVASDFDKPDGLVVVEPGDVRSFLAPLPVDELHGIGPVTAGELRERGIETVGELADADREWLADEYGQRGRELHDRARGIDDREVQTRGRPKSLSRESAFADPESDHDAVSERVQALAAAVADRARSKGALYRTIGIKVVTPPYDVNTRAQSLSGPVDDPSLVEAVALDLLSEFEDDRPRKVGVRVSNLSFSDADQSTLGGWDGQHATDATGDDAEPPGAATAEQDGTAFTLDADDEERTLDAANESEQGPLDDEERTLDVEGEEGTLAVESGQATLTLDWPTSTDDATSRGPSDSGRHRHGRVSPEQTTLLEFLDGDPATETDG